MFIPLVIVVVGLLGVACAGSSSAIIKRHEELRTRILGDHVNDVPDIFKPKNLIGEKVVSSSTYSETGWISITYFAADNGCIDPAMTSGTAVNRCVNRKIFRLFSDSCTGAVVEEYLDDSCTVLDTSRQLNYAGTCTILGDTTYQTSCTTNSGFSLAYNAVVTTDYLDDNCATAAAFTGVSTQLCEGTTDYSCSGDTATLNTYSVEGCAGTKTSAVIPTTCTPAPAGDEFNSFTKMCMGGADASFLLDARAIAALVIGGVAFLAL